MRLHFLIRTAAQKEKLMSIKNFVLKLLTMKCIIVSVVFDQGRNNIFLDFRKFKIRDKGRKRLKGLYNKMIPINLLLF